MNRNRITLKESQLKQMISECVKNTLNKLDEKTSTPDTFTQQRVDAAQGYKYEHPVDEDKKLLELRYKLSDIMLVAHDMQDWYYTKEKKYRILDTFIEKMNSAINVFEHLCNDFIMDQGEQPSSFYHKPKGKARQYRV